MDFGKWPVIHKYLLLSLAMFFVNIRIIFLLKRKSSPDSTMSIIPPLLFLLQATLTYGRNIISVTNGVQLDEWGDWQVCPTGHIARAFQTKVEPKHWYWFIFDDTAMNGIMLHCTKPGSFHIAQSISSSVGSWGNWGPVLWCPNGYFDRFKLKVERYQLFIDNTAVNRLTFRCSDNTILEGNGLDWGTYGIWSDICYKGISGIRTRVLRNRGVFGDDMALLDVQFLCSEN
ncbi:vitelline membrane outer layer protein 1 homolog [Hyperolius riggenbachi]|uniref:vitelline membrane outer layer protein 1 homolog n=1 Tax=Hyperolius riggenbachi TaxID=752182 RepID=UPI0035A32C12